MSLLGGHAWASEPSTIKEATQQADVVFVGIADPAHGAKTSFETLVAYKGTPGLVTAHGCPKGFVAGKTYTVFASERSGVLQSDCGFTKRGWFSADEDPRGGHRRSGRRNVTGRGPARVVLLGQQLLLRPGVLDPVPDRGSARGSDLCRLPDTHAEAPDLARSPEARTNFFRHRQLSDAVCTSIAGDAERISGSLRPMAEENLPHGRGRFRARRSSGNAPPLGAGRETEDEANVRRSAARFPLRRSRGSSTSGEASRNRRR
jgi:hypothetical protein